MEENKVCAEGRMAEGRKLSFCHSSVVFWVATEQGVQYAARLPFRTETQDRESKTYPS